LKILWIDIIVLDWIQFLGGTLGYYALTLWVRDCPFPPPLEPYFIKPTEGGLFPFHSPLEP
jgi:hypothetical protein